MKRMICMAAVGLMMASAAWAASPINYDGTTLTWNNDFTRTECGTMSKNVMPETSGMACSRTTPGYLWAHGDENTGSNKKIVAIQPSGTLAMTLTISGDPGRDDWEDIATGVYNDQNYLFIGAFGDNDLAHNDQYYIYYCQEPAITSGTKSVTVNYIKFGYPDNHPHNTETLMYDNVEQMFYIVDKVKNGVCHLYKLPFRTDYGTGVQRLTEVCALGNGSKFNYCTGGDISPDGRWMAIKSKPYVLLWERQGSESLSSTATRHPQQIAAYQEEEQGEALAWLDSTTFYTTSDSKSNTPIYKYVRTFGSTVTPGDTTQTDTVPVTPPAADSTLKAVNQIVLSNGYNAYINSGETMVRGWYVAGMDQPTVASCLLSAGATWKQQGNSLVVTALNGTSDTYSLDIQPVTPVAFTAQEIVFDGTESSWVKSAYGWDGTKKWRFSKTDDDYSREMAGKTHVELFLPACDTVVLKSMSTERKVRFYVNGEQLGQETKLLTAGNTLVVAQQAPFMLTIASAQSSGDGGIAAIRMARRAGATGVEQVTTETESARKVLINGQLYILRGSSIYSQDGRQIR